MMGHWKVARNTLQEEQWWQSFAARPECSVCGTVTNSLLENRGVINTLTVLLLDTVMTPKLQRYHYDILYIKEISPSRPQTLRSEGEGNGGGEEVAMALREEET